MDLDCEIWKITKDSELTLNKDELVNIITLERRKEDMYISSWSTFEILEDFLGYEKEYFMKEVTKNIDKNNNDYFLIETKRNKYIITLSF